jgi:DUF4097 and DUF4098 domain-containing protein YvlB
MLSAAARTVSGSVKCDIPLKEVYGKCDTKLKAVFNAGGPYLEIKTINGNIVSSAN